MVGRNVQFRNTTCACSACVVSNYEECVSNSKWTSINLEKQQRNQRRGGTQRRSTQVLVGSSTDDDDSDSPEESAAGLEVREHINDAVARTSMRMSDTFETRNARITNRNTELTTRAANREIRKSKQVYISEKLMKL
jgi:hypothetical protein